jgi:hypothetical protein
MGQVWKVGDQQAFVLAVFAQGRVADHLTLQVVVARAGEMYVVTRTSTASR